MPLTLIRHVRRNRRCRPCGPALLVAAALLVANTTAGAQGAATSPSSQPEGMNLVLGLKLWQSQFSIQIPFPVTVGGERLTPVESEAALVFIPQLSLRYRDWVATLSTQIAKDYSILFYDGSSLLTIGRSEVDFNLGYYVVPGLAASLGYKRFKLKLDNATDSFTGPTFGLSGTAPLGSDLSLYAAAGFASLKDSAPARAGLASPGSRAKYQLTEVGLAYALSGASIARTAGLTLGYRTQTLKAPTTLRGTTPGSSYKADARHQSSGVTLGLVAAF